MSLQEQDYIIGPIDYIKAIKLKDKINYIINYCVPIHFEWLVLTTMASSFTHMVNRGHSLA